MVFNSRVVPVFMLHLTKISSPSLGRIEVFTHTDLKGRAIQSTIVIFDSVFLWYPR